MEYTHNLKLLLLDNNDNIIEDNVFLDQIKNILCQNSTNILKWNGQNENFIIKWNQVELSNINKHFMGDLFACPMYENDKIVLNHTQQTISKINSKYTIKFYISRIIYEKKNLKDTVGIIF